MVDRPIRRLLMIGCTDIGTTGRRLDALAVTFCSALSAADPCTQSIVVARASDPASSEGGGLVEDGHGEFGSGCRAGDGPDLQS